MTDYETKAMETEASQTNILNRFLGKPFSEQLKYIRLENGIRGLTDEVGELNCCIKRWFEYGEELDEANIKEEVGDCFWRLAQICKAVGLTFEECQQANLRKLQEGRYKEGYSEEAAREENRNRNEERELVVDEVDSEGLPPEQNGVGWSEYPEVDEVCFGITPPVSVKSALVNKLNNPVTDIVLLTPEKFKEIVELLYTLASFSEGQDYTMSLKHIATVLSGELEGYRKEWHGKDDTNAS